jgi:hypothetical protein
MFSCIVVCCGVLTGGLSDTYAQSLPDLVVTKIECVKPDGMLRITVANKSNAPLSTLAKPVADVYFGGMKVGLVDLKRPTSGSIMKANGVATYLTYFYISSSFAVKVVVDPLKTIKESNEANNSLTQSLAPCIPQVSLDY